LRPKEQLRKEILALDGRGYKAYRRIEGAYDFGGYALHIDRAQGDPFASPSRVRVVLKSEYAGFAAEHMSSRSRIVALGDFLTRKFALEARTYGKGIRGTGNSGLIAIDEPGQEVLERTSVLPGPAGIEARFVVGLPARGRTVLARVAESLFFDEIPKTVEASLRLKSLDSKALSKHLESVEDQDFLRSSLEERGLVAFVARGSILPRRSGVDDRPLRTGLVVPFQSPDSMTVEFELPNQGKVAGMGIPKGVTLIVGGGYHGKSTLLRALELGVYNHIPGDGRELVSTVESAVKIRAEDGRSIEKVGIDPFISNLPYGKDTTQFSTDEASGSTSQAANIIEALEAGTGVLLVDEDTSATNFMIRDHRMQELVSKDKEPITPFIDKVRLLSRDLNVSTVIVVGGSGDYFDVADCVVMMDSYVPKDVTEAARGIARKYRAERVREGGSSFGKISNRLPVPASFDASKGRKSIKISAKGTSGILFGKHLIDLSSVEQVVSPSQTRAIADSIIYLRDRYMDGRKSLSELLDLLERDFSEHGLDVLCSGKAGDYARPRKYEVAAAINRLRGMVMKAGSHGMKESGPSG